MSLLRLLIVFEPLELSHVSVKIVRLYLNHWNSAMSLLRLSIVFEPLEHSHVSVKIVVCI